MVQGRVLKEAFTELYRLAQFKEASVQLWQIMYIGMTEGFIRILNLLEIQDWEMGLLRDFLNLIDSMKI